MTPTPVPSNPRVKVKKRQVQARKRIMLQKNVTYGQLAAAAGVTYSMVYKWVSGLRTSSVIEAAYVKLTGDAA